METFGNIMFVIAMMLLIGMAIMGLVDNQKYDGEERPSQYKFGQWMAYSIIIVLAVIFALWAGIAEHTSRAPRVNIGSS